MTARHPRAASCYHLADVRFTSKAAIKKYIRAYIEATPLGATVTDSVLIELLHKHPRWAEKSEGMTRLMVGMVVVEHASVRQKAVLIEKGVNHTDITWSKLVDRLQHDGSLRHVDDRRENLSKIKLAARAAIQDQIMRVKKSTGDHIDHIYPRTFDRLLFLFLKWWNQPLCSIGVEDPEGLILQPRFRCWELEDSWALFHERTARLRAVPPAVNMAAPIYPINWDLLP